MNEPTIRLEPRPEVATFVAQVRERLADLTDEEREELVGGLEADIAELVADGGSTGELGDPRAYADEMRAAAGLERRASGARQDGLADAPRPRPTWGERAGSVLDRCRSRWAELVDVPALNASWGFLVTLRPVWWVLRAWVAVQLFDIATQGGDTATVLPMIGGPVVGSLLWLAAIVVSVQIGRNQLWPGSGAGRKVLARTVLLGLNAFAVLMAPIALSQFPADGTRDHQGYGVAEPSAGLQMSGAPVTNVFPYDADGNPLEGVQLFDENGEPLTVRRDAGELYVDRTDRVSVLYPWFNGQKRLYNVFPLPRREHSTASGGWWHVRDDAWTSPNPPALPTPPLAVVPPVSLPSADEDVPADEKAPAEEGTVADEADSENPEAR